MRCARIIDRGTDRKSRALLLGVLGFVLLAMGGHAQDAQMRSFTAPRYAVIGQDLTLHALVRNAGTSALDSFVVTMALDSTPLDTTVYKPSPNLPGDELYALQLDTPLNLPSEGPHEVAVWVQALPADGFAGNDTLRATVQGIPAGTQRTVLLEKTTCRNCGSCPLGVGELMDLAAQYPDRLIASVLHDNDQGTDSMTTADGEAIQNLLGAGRNPSGTIGRVTMPGLSEPFASHELWDVLVRGRMEHPSPITVTLDPSYDPASRELSLTVTAEAVAPVTGELRFNGFVLEDSIAGEGEGYAQRSYFNNNPASRWHQRGNPIQDFYHRDVLRDVLGNTSGDAQHLNDTLQPGDTRQQTYTTTLAPAWDASQVKLVGTVFQYFPANNAFEALNSAATPLAVATDRTTSKAATPRWHVGPNPSHGRLTLWREPTSRAPLQLRLRNAQGRLVVSRHYPPQAAGKRIRLDISQLPPGYYSLSLRSAGRHAVKKLLLAP
jgi:hypothetical protein